MKRAFSLISTLVVVFFLSCGDDEPKRPECIDPIGSELLTYTYNNPGTPNISNLPINESQNITYGTPRAVVSGGEVEITIPGIRVRTQNNNFEITAIQVDEQVQGDNCFVNQAEFNQTRTSFQTNISSVLVLDMSTSILGIVDDLKDYAKEYASTIVNSSSQSQVAVVFFSSRSAIQRTEFYTSTNIGQLHTLIDNFENFQERTALYQATLEGIDLLESNVFDGEKSLVVFTDGGDNDSNNPSTLVNEINASGVNVFAIGLRGGDFRENNLASIVSNASNLVIAETNEDLQQVFRTVGRGVISVYTVVYNRSDQLLSSDESIESRFSFETMAIDP